VYTANGWVIRHLRNNDREILTPDGTRTYFDRKKRLWTVINNRGIRNYVHKVEWTGEPVPCAVETDAVSLARVMIREDSVMSITFSDGSIYT